MLIDCDSCTGRGHACGDCVVSVFLGSPAVPGSPSAPGVLGGASEPLDLDASEAQALGVLADAGLIPPLRHIRPA